MGGGDYVIRLDGCPCGFYASVYCITESEMPATHTYLHPHEGCTRTKHGHGLHMALRPHAARASFANSPYTSRRFPTPNPEH